MTVTGGSALEDVRGLLVDIDGVLMVSWVPILGAPEALAELRELGIPFRLVTNTTSHGRTALAAELGRIGFDVSPDELLTAPAATGAYLRAHHPEARVFLLGEADLTEELEGLRLVEDGADVVVIGGADQAFTFDNLNRALRMVLDGAALVAMHRNLSWLTNEGLSLDAGAYLLGLERAAGVEAAVCGKPSPEVFDQGVAGLGLVPGQVAMVGDDLDTDVLAAQSCGLIGVLALSGKHRGRPETGREGLPDVVVDRFAEVPDLLRRA
jgi:HAD superfamily hydrolase (TIGR01458 family)